MVNHIWIIFPRKARENTLYKGDKVFAKVIAKVTSRPVQSSEAAKNQLTVRCFQAQFKKTQPSYGAEEIESGHLGVLQKEDESSLAEDEEDIELHCE